MAMDLLGPSIEDLFNKCSRKFSLKTVLQIADQMLERIDTMHARHLIHRDIKPANFVIGGGIVKGVDHVNTIFAVDFGLSKRYRHPKNLHHMPHREGRSLTGTPRYASINNHIGVEQSRRDDLESLGYVFIYLLNGSLPWQGLKAKNPQKKYRLILEKKQDISIQQLCSGIPREFGDILAYARALSFDARPDIPRLRKLLRECYHNYNCHKQPGTWDWDGMDINIGDRASGDGEGGERDDAIDPNVIDEQHFDGVARGPGDGDLNPEAARPTTSGAILGTDVGEAPRPGTAWFGETSTEELPQARGTAQESEANVPRSRASPTPGADPTGGGDVPVDDMAGQLNGMALAMARAREAGLVPPEDAPDNGAVVAGARAMMRYRRQKSPVDPSGSATSLYASSTQPSLPVSKPGTSAGRFYAGGAANALRPKSVEQTTAGGESGNGVGARRGVLGGTDPRARKGPVSRRSTAQRQQSLQQRAATAGDVMRPSASSGSRPRGLGSNTSSSLKPR